MEVTELKNESLCCEVKVVVPAAEINKKIDKQLVDLSKKIVLHGFRSGKAPISIVKKKYYGSVRRDFVNEEITKFCDDFIKDRKLNIIGSPKVDVLKNIENFDLEFILKFDLVPEIDIPDLKSISVIRPKVPVLDEDLQEYLDKLSEDNLNYDLIVDEESKDGYGVNIDAVGYMDGKEFPEGKVNGYLLVLGSRKFIPGFEDQLINKKSKEEVEVNVSFPDDYFVKNLAGKPVKFVVNINSVHKPEKSIIDDEFAKRFKCSCLDDLKKDVSLSIENERKSIVDSVMKMSLFNQLDDMLNFEIPSSLFSQEKTILQNQITKDEDAYGMFDGKTPEEIEKYYDKLAERRVRIGLMLSEYAKLNGVFVTEKDVQTAMWNDVMNFPGDKDMLVDFYRKNPEIISDRLRGPLLEEKSVKHIFENQVIIVEKEMNGSELEKFFEEEETKTLRV